MANSKKYAARMSLDPKSWRDFEKKLQNLEKVARKQIQDKALQAGADILKDEANANAPGPHIVAEVVSGRTLKKKRKSAGVKNNSRVAAVGPDKKHWYYHFAEYGATKHDISVDDPGLVKLYPLGAVIRRWAKMTGGIRKFAFLRRAFESKKAAAIKEMGRVLGEEIIKAFKGG